MSTSPPSASSSTPSTPPEAPRRGRSLLRVLRAALSGEEHDYTTGNLNRAIVLLAIPMVLEMAMESLFAICDIFWVTKLGRDATAAVGLTESVLTLYYAIAVGLSMATTAIVARRIGEKRPEAAAHAGSQAIYLGLLVGISTGIPCWIWAPEILRLMGASESVITHGSGYTRVIMGTNAVILLLFLNNAIFRGAGDAALAMRALWLGNGINIVLDPCLIFGYGPFPEMGLEGAAWATVIGRSTALVYQAYHLHRGTGRLRLNRQALAFDWKNALHLAHVSLGGIGQMIIATTSWVALMRLMAAFGSAGLAGYTIGIRIIMFTILPSWGLSNAAATLVGQSLGAGKPERAERAVWLTGFYNMGFLAVVMMIFLTFGDPLVRIFSSEPEIVRIGTLCLRIFSYGYLFFGWGMVLTQAFNGAGDTMTPTKLNFMVFWVFQIPLAWYLARECSWGPRGVFWAVVAADGLLAISAAVLFFRGSWKTRQV